MKKINIFLSILSVVALLPFNSVFALAGQGGVLYTNHPANFECSNSSDYVATFLSAPSWITNGVWVMPPCTESGSDLGYPTWGDFYNQFVNWNGANPFTFYLVETNNYSACEGTLAQCLSSGDVVAESAVTSTSFIPTPPLLSLPATAVADLTGTATQFFSDIWGIIALFIGVPLGFYLIYRISKLVKQKAD